MDGFLNYLLESGICLGFMYLFYLAFFRKEMQFQFIRLYFIFSIAISLIIPFIELNPINSVPQTLPERVIDSFVVGSDYVRDNVRVEFGFIDWLFYIYILGMVLMSLRFSAKILKIGKFITECEHVSYKGYKLLISERKIDPCSFLNHIFIDRETYDSKEIELIIAHESVHIRQYHSFDIILFEIVSIIQWFNPFIYMIGRIARENHEFIADRFSMIHNPDIYNYQTILMNYALQNKISAITNNFSNSILFRRIKMLSTIQSSMMSYYKIATVTFLMILLTFFFACTKDKITNPQKELSIDGYITDINGDKHIPDVSPKPSIGYDGLNEYFDKNLKYPEQAKDKDITCKINVGCVIESDGSISNVRVLNGKLADDDKWSPKIGYGFDEEAIRVVKAMPRWNPAMYKGKAYARDHMVGVIFGNKKVWDAKNQPTMIVETGKPHSNPDKGIDFEKLNDSCVITEFPGGYKKMTEFLLKNIHYPESGIKNNISGIVHVSFIVDEEGSITQAKVKSGINEDFDREALRVVNLMPKWVPEVHDGKKQKAKVLLPISFKLK
jgi:TonB family protein